MFIATEHNLGKVQNMLVDSGYIGEQFATAIKNILGCGFEVVKKSDLHKIQSNAEALDSGKNFCVA